MLTKERTRCIYRVIEPNIHEFVMTEASRAAVDDLIATLDEINAAAVPGEVWYNLMDSSVGVQPIAYIFGQTRDLMKRYPQQLNTRFALILPPGPLVKGVEIMLQAFPGVQTRIFPSDKRDAAIAWLCEGAGP